MKIILIFLAIILSTMARADSRPYGVAGCGFGNVIFGPRDTQVLAATTNHISFTQAFAISSGTSNCWDSGTVKKGKELSAFIELNQQKLSVEMAKGQGETLSSLSSLLNCANESALNTSLQRNYGRIYSTSPIAPERVEQSIRNVIKETPELSSSCRLG